MYVCLFGYGTAVNQTRAKRRATVQSLRLAGFQEFTESVARNSLNLLTLGRRKRRERNFLEPWVGTSVKAAPPEESSSSSRAAITEEDNSLGDGAVRSA